MQRISLLLADCPQAFASNNDHKQRIGAIEADVTRRLLAALHGKRMRMYVKRRPTCLELAMPTLEEDNQLVQTVISTLARMASHPHVHVAALEEVLNDVHQELTHTKLSQLSLDRYQQIRSSAAAKAGRGKAHAEIDRVLFEDYGLLRHDGDMVSVEAQRHGARYSGTAIVAEDRQRWRPLLAHQHVLAFPETIEVLELFAPPGQLASVAQSLQHHFVYFRKLNDVTVDYTVDELVNLKLLQKSVGNMRAVWGPPTMLAGLTVKHYLSLTEYRVDVAVEWEQLLSQVSNVLPPKLFERHPVGSSWLQRLNGPVDLFSSEVGGTRVRLGIQGLRWFAEQGLVAPIDCGKVLRQRRAKVALLQLRDAICERMTKVGATNAETIASVLSPL